MLYTSIVSGDSCGICLSKKCCATLVRPQLTTLPITKDNKNDKGEKYIDVSFFAFTVYNSLFHSPRYINSAASKLDGKKNCPLHYLKKILHVGNSGCLSSVPILWLASSAAPAVIFTKEDSDDR